MPQVTASISDDTSKLIDGVVAAGLYSGRSDVVRDHLRSYIRSNPELSREIAIELYLGDEIDFITACRMADRSAREMETLLNDKIEEQ